MPMPMPMPTIRTDCDLCKRAHNGKCPTQLGYPSCPDEYVHVQGGEDEDEDEDEDDMINDLPYDSWGAIGSQTF